MTKLRIEFPLTRTLDEADAARLAPESAVYGIERVWIAPSLDRITVEYDATRMDEAGLRRELADLGLPLEAGVSA